MSTVSDTAVDPTPTVAYAGIDVAFAKNKLLPIAVCIRVGTGLQPLPLRGFGDVRPPRGSGNRATLDPETVARFADDALAYLRAVERRFAVRIAEVAIDASREPAPEHSRRACERAIGRAGWSCFMTPSRSEWAEVRRKVTDHFAQGGCESRMPYANKLWMLVGFALFERLERVFPCIEVFPSAIVRGFDRGVPHKTTPNGFARQLAILRRGVSVDDRQFANSGHGSRHDRLDALLSAWVASTDASSRVGYGDGNRDTIWAVRPAAFSI